MELVTDRARIVVVGEGMIEATVSEPGLWRMGSGGDTLNTAIHLARFGHSVSYVTALGTDRHSQTLRAAWQAEGLDLTHTLAHPTRKPGLYVVETDAVGERSFTYWRENSAAREMFVLPGANETLAAIADADMIVFSLITLAVLPEESRRRLIAACAARASGARTAFDGNYRPSLWHSAAQARDARNAALKVTDIGLPTLSDERLMDDSLITGGTTQDAQDVARGWVAAGAGEVVVKLGEDGCLLPDGTLCSPPQVLVPVDTSGAGDAFNAGFLAGKLAGWTQPAAAALGHRLAGWVIQRRGAVPVRDAEGPYSI